MKTEDIHNPDKGMGRTAEKHKIVFWDLIRVLARHRKEAIEFPTSLNALDGYLRQDGYGQIDYVFNKS